MPFLNTIDLEFGVGSLRSNLGQSCKGWMDPLRKAGLLHPTQKAANYPLQDIDALEDPVRSQVIDPNLPNDIRMILDS